MYWLCVYKQEGLQLHIPPPSGEYTISGDRSIYIHTGPLAGEHWLLHAGMLVAAVVNHNTGKGTCVEHSMHDYTKNEGTFDRLKKMIKSATSSCYG